MENLTFSKRVVVHVPDLNPVPGMRLVVYRRMGAGERLERVLEPGERMPLGFFQRKDAFMAYAVSTDPNLRHEFFGDYQHFRQTRTIYLRFRLAFRTAAPDLLVEQRSTDPLRRLQDETKSVVGETVRKMEWNQIKEDPNTVGQLALLETRNGPTGPVQTNIEHLQDFARSLGFEVVDIQVGCRFDTEGNTDLATAESETLKRRVEQETHKTNRLKLEQAKELEAISEQHDHHRQAREAVMAGFRRVMENISSRIDSADELRRTMRELVELQNTVGGLQLNNGGAQLPPGGPAILTAGNNQAGGLEALATTTIAQVRDLPCSEEERREVLSTALHILAESLRGDHADKERLHAWVLEMRQIHQQMLRCFRDDSQRRFFKRFVDPERLRREVEGE